MKAAKTITFAVLAILVIGAAIAAYRAAAVRNSDPASWSLANYSNR